MRYFSGERNTVWRTWYWSVSSIPRQIQTTSKCLYPRQVVHRLYTYDTLTHLIQRKKTFSKFFVSDPKLNLLSSGLLGSVCSEEVERSWILIHCRVWKGSLLNLRIIVFFFLPCFDKALGRHIFVDLLVEWTYLWKELWCLVCFSWA